jgi:hypothetical protein
VSSRHILGTSLAAPLVAGAAALLLQAKGTKNFLPLLNQWEVGPQNLFQSTALAVRSSIDINSRPQSLALQGTGLIQAYNAANYKTTVTPSVLHCNDTAFAKYTHKVYLLQSSSSSKTYTITHVPSVTVDTISGIQPNISPVAASNVATVQLSSSTVTVPGMWSNMLSPTVVTVTITPPINVNPTFAVYSGQIKFTCEELGETLVTSYMGVVGAMKNMKVIDNTNWCKSCFRDYMKHC